jgi:putative DNA primase/helicase
MNQATPASVHDAVSEYGGAGWAPVPLAPKSKKPFHPNWPDRDYVGEGIEVSFSADINVGLKCGSPSQGLVDVDIDDRRALKIANRFLSPTGLRHGRACNRDSHWWYRVTSNVGTTCQFRDPK